MISVKSFLMATAGAAFVAFTVAEGALAASFGYVTGSSDPWGNQTNDQAMDTAFGAGNWQKFSFDNAVSSGTFSPGAYKMLFFDGGAQGSTAFENFINTNRNTLESWVAAGGSLFLNAARWNHTPNFNLGFGAQLQFELSSTGVAADPSHPIFNGPNGVAGTSFSGSSFAHDYITGAGLTSLINGQSGSVLAERSFGLGHLLLGGITTPNFHSPQPNATILRANILDYAADKAYSPAHSVPEPASIIGILAFGFLGGSKLLKRKQRVEA